MEQQIIALVNQHIAQLFTEAKNTLLHPDSYTQEVETKHLLHYFRFLESAFQKPYNRLISLAAFVNDNGGLMTSKMYPLIALKADARNAIMTKSNQVMSVANGLEVGGIDPEINALCSEKYVGKE